MNFDNIIAITFRLLVLGSRGRECDLCYLDEVTLEYTFPI